MIWKHTNLGSLVDVLRTLFFPEFLPKFARNIVYFLGSFMGRVIRCHRDVATKRLQRRCRKHEGFKHKWRGSKCHCNKHKINYSDYRTVQRERVLNSDFLANLAYTYRIWKNYKRPIGDEAGEENRRSYNVNDRLLVKSSYQDVSTDIKDVQKCDYDGQTWWIGMRQCYVPPLHQDVIGSSKSEYSSTTLDFRSQTPDFSLTTSRNSSLDFSTLGIRSCPIERISHSRRRKGSKSESKILQMRQNRKTLDVPLRSASMKTLLNFRRPPEDRRNLLKRNRKFEKDRPMSRATSHDIDCFSTYVHCSRILSKST